MINFSKLCTPAKIYFAIAVIATIFDLFNGVSFMFAFWKMLFAFVWTFILGGLCDKGYKSISWVLVLLPYILMFLASLNIYHVTEEQRQFMRSIQLQGAYGQEAFSDSGNTDAALKNLTHMEIDNLAIPTHPRDLITFDNDIKNANTDSLKKVAAKIEWEIILLDKAINNLKATAPLRGLKEHQKRVQEKKLNKVNAEINRRS
jgi:hypothetical protein